VTIRQACALDTQFGFLLDIKVADVVFGLAVVLCFERDKCVFSCLFGFYELNKLVKFVTSQLSS
jgi:hypothetical protein